MFFVTDDEKRIVDSRGRVVGFLRGERFSQDSQVDNDGNWTVIQAPYDKGLAPMELELVSETIQRNKIRKTGSDVEV